MSQTEERILEKVRQLSEADQQDVLAYIERKVIVETFDYEAWSTEVDAFQAELTGKYGDSYRIGVQDLLDELREESSWLR